MPMPPVVARIRSRRSVLKIRANEPSVVLQLTSTQLASHMRQWPRLREAYERTAQMVADATMPDAFHTHWLLGEASSPLKLLVSSWQPRVYAESAHIVDQVLAAEHRASLATLPLLIHSGPVL